MKKIALVAVALMLLAVFLLMLDAHRVTTAAARAPQTTLPSFGWVKTWGGSSTEMAKGVAVDTSGNVYVIGEFAGTVNFDPAGPNPSATRTSYNNTLDAYLTKFNASGTWQWTRIWGAGPVSALSYMGRDAANGIALDSAGNVYVVGLYQGTVDFGSGFIFPSNAPMGSNNVFAAKFNSNGVTQWVKTWGANSGGEAYSVAVDPAGYVYVQGDWSGVSCDFDQYGAHDVHLNHGHFDAFLVKLRASDGAFQWAKTWGGEGYDDGPGVAVDSLGYVYVAGMYASKTINFDPAGVHPDGDKHPAHDSGSLVDVFLSKFDSAGNFLWVRTWGGQGTDDAGQMVTIDHANNIYVGGRYGCITCEFNPATTAHPHANGDLDAFVSKYDSAGNLLWLKTWGGASADASAGLVVDQQNNLHVTGVYSATVNFDPDGAGDTRTANGLWDASITTFDSSGNFQGAQTWGGSGQDGIWNATIDANNHLYIAGYFSAPGTVDFDPGTGTAHRASQGGMDAYLSKFVIPLAPATSSRLYLPFIIRSQP